MGPARPDSSKCQRKRGQAGRMGGRSVKVIIVGGVAGGASCAARLRRLDEQADIVLLERGPYVSYANCGLPYHVGGVIEKEPSLLVANEQVFRSLYRIDVRTGCEVMKILPKQKTVELRSAATGEVTRESYDKLVLSPGAAPIRPPLPGIDLPGIFSVRTVPDAREIRRWIEEHKAHASGMHTYTGFQTVRPTLRAVVVGGGFIGLEMAENLVHQELEVTLIERGGQLVDPIDPEMARYVERHMEKHGVRLVLSDGAASFAQAADGSLEGAHAVGQGLPGRHRRAWHRRAARDGAGQGGRPRDRGTRWDPRRRAHAHQRPGHLRRGRCGRGQGHRHRAVVADRPGRAGQPPGPHRRRWDRRPRLPLPRHAGHGHHRPVRRRRRLDRRLREVARAQRRYGLREDLPVPQLACRLLPRRQDTWR